MPSIFQNKRVLLLIGGFVIIIAAILVFARGGGSPAVPSSPAAPFLSAAPATPVSAALGQDLLSALALLKTIRIDTKFFADPAFQSLSDWGKQIPSQPVGRRNPFAPLGVPAAPAASAASKPSAPASGQAGTGAPPPVAPPASAQTPPTASPSDADVWDFSNIDFTF